MGQKKADWLALLWAAETVACSDCCSAAQMVVEMAGTTALLLVATSGFQTD
jgi:hypothetical protein